LAHQLKGSVGGYGFPVSAGAAGHPDASARAREDLNRLRGQFEVPEDLYRRARARVAAG